MLPGPTVPPAPGLFSIRTGWPTYFVAISAKRRRWVSVDPPGGQGQISVIGRDGNSCAAAGSARTSPSSASLRASECMRLLQPKRARLPTPAGERDTARSRKLAENAQERQRTAQASRRTTIKSALSRPPMPVDVSRPDLSLAVIGTGVMGRGIAQIAAQAGVRTLLHDSRPGAAREAKDALSRQLSRLAEKGRLDRDAVARAEASLVVADSLAALSPCHIVIEAIVENLDAKRELFHALETIVAEDCLLATNTSSLSVTAIAAACKRPERVGGFHFFNPVPLMKVVEVVDGLLTAPWVGEALTALALRCGHKPVRAKDTPGFIVNHAGRDYGTEALRILGA